MHQCNLRDGQIIAGLRSKKFVCLFVTIPIKIILNIQIFVCNYIHNP